MKPEEIRSRINAAEFRFSTSRSSGPGGQNVNKVNTKVELRFNIPASASLTDTEKELIMDLLAKRINSEGDLLIVSQSERSQSGNKSKAEERFYRLLSRALTVRPERKPTKSTAASKARRLEEKKKRGIIKNLRSRNVSEA